MLHQQALTLVWPISAVVALGPQDAQVLAAVAPLAGE